MLPASPMGLKAFRSRRFDAAWKLPSGLHGCCDRTSARIHDRVSCIQFGAFGWLSFGYQIWQLYFTSFISFKRYTLNKMGSKPTRAVDECSRQLTSNSSLMGLESQYTNASKGFVCICFLRYPWHSCKRVKSPMYKIVYIYIVVIYGTYWYMHLMYLKGCVCI